jgi:ABC-2 type transport system permease protein
MNLLAHVRGSIREPEFWAYSGWLDIVTKYRRSKLGLLWLVIPPSVYILGVGYYYASLMGSEPAHFMVHLGVGYLLFRFFMTSIVESAAILPASASFILDGHSRLTDFVFRVMAKGLFYLVVSLPVLAIPMIWGTGIHLAGFITLLPALAVLVINTFWLSLAGSLLGARFPDVSELMTSLFIFAFILTPILWSPSFAPAGTIHGTLMRLNPLYHLIEIVRAPLLGGQIESLTILYLSCLTLGGLVATALLYRRYARFVPLWV